MDSASHNHSRRPAASADHRAEAGSRRSGPVDDRAGAGSRRSGPVDGRAGAGSRRREVEPCRAEMERAALQPFADKIAKSAAMQKRPRGRPRKPIPEGYVLDDSPRRSGSGCRSGRLPRVQLATHEARAANHPLFEEGRVANLGNWFARAYELAGRVVAFSEDSLRGAHPYFRQSFLLYITFAGVLFTLIGPPVSWLLFWTADKIYHRAKRPTYYPAERARRLALAAERRKIRRRSTTNPMPAAQDLLDQFAKAKSSPVEMIRFGSMLEDLECHVDNRLQFADDGSISGRNGGVKRWLQVNCPPLFDRYKTAMRYKQLSRKFRQASGIADPEPAADALDAPEAKAILDEAGRTAKGLADALRARLDPSLVRPLPFPASPTAPAETG